jgi:hypothetical protein
MRKRIGFISFLYQIVLAAALIGAQVFDGSQSPNSLTPAMILAYGFADVWFGASIGYKTSYMMPGHKGNWGFWTCAIFVLTAVTYLIAANPGPTAPNSILGLVFCISLFVMFMIDLIDSAIQKYCK